MAERDIAEKLDGKEAKATVVELTLEPGQAGKPHRHAGPVFGYVLEGEYEYAIDDQPAKVLKAGDTFYEPTGCLHRVSRNPGEGQDPGAGHDPAPAGRQTDHGPGAGQKVGGGLPAEPRDPAPGPGGPPRARRVEGDAVGLLPRPTPSRSSRRRGRRETRPSRPPPTGPWPRPPPSGTAAAASMSVHVLPPSAVTAAVAPVFSGRLKSPPTITPWSLSRKAIEKAPAEAFPALTGVSVTDQVRPAVGGTEHPRRLGPAGHEPGVPVAAGDQAGAAGRERPLVGEDARRQVFFRERLPGLPAVVRGHQLEPPLNRVAQGEAGLLVPECEGVEERRPGRGSGTGAPTSCRRRSSCRSATRSPSPAARR